MKSEEIKLNDLKKVAKELNELLFAESTPEEKINVKVAEPELKALIVEAFGLLEEGELETMSKLAQGIHEAIMPTDEDVEEDQENDEEDEEEIEEEKPVKKSTKKEPIKETPAPKKGKKQVEPEPEPEDEEEIEEEQPVKKAEKKSGNKQTSTPGKGPGIIAKIVECVEKAGKKGISREEIHAILIKTFPDRDAASMMKTIKVQVPARINKEKWAVQTVSEGFYKKA